MSTIPFLVVVGLLLPWQAWSSRCWLAQAAPEDLPSPRALAWQALLTQAVVGALAWLAAYGAGLRIPLRSRLSSAAILAAVALLALALAVAWFEARRPLAPADALRRSLRRIPAWDPPWLAATAAAALVEEFAYRGVLTALLATSLGTAGATLLSAALFGLAHASQGWRAAATGTLFALAFQGLVTLSGGLLLAMAVHLAYDLGAAAMGRRLARAEDEADVQAM